MPEANDTAKPKTEKISVTMSDGRTVEFGKKQKLNKNSTINDDGSITTVLDFSNGETRSFTAKPTDSIFAKLAAHGAEQKLGDAIAGESEIGDAVLAVDDVLTRLNNGEWTAQRASGSFAGTSVLIQALMEASGKTVDEVKAYLSDKTMAQKHALRRTDLLKPIIDRLESEKQSKSKSTVDTAALLGELGLNSGSTSKKAAKVAENA